LLLVLGQEVKGQVKTIVGANGLHAHQVSPAAPGVKDHGAGRFTFQQIAYFPSLPALQKTESVTPRKVCKGESLASLAEGKNASR